MAAKSNNKYDVFDWIKKIIDSCETSKQLVRCIPLMKCFNTMYKDSGLYDELRWYETCRWNRLGEKEKGSEKQLLKG